MAKQVFDFRPGKGFTVAQSNEHQRRWTEKGWRSATHSGNYDRTRSALNFEVVRGGKVSLLIRATLFLNDGHEPKGSWYQGPE